VAPEPAVKGRAYPDQWHAAFVAREPSREAEYVVALRIGCKGEAPRATREDGGWRVTGTGGARSVLLKGTETAVR
jgi:hypothetical protein